MTGGLIQIASYGTQDLFLTGTPEITYFKVVYRRHTAFSMESIRVGFDDDVGFGKESTVAIPKIGDLIYKMYLEITIPEITLKRDTVDSSAYKTSMDTAKAELITVQRFMRINLRAYRNGYDQYIASNVETSEPIKADILQTFSTASDEPITNIQSLLNAGSNTHGIKYSDISLKPMANRFNGTEDKDDILNAMEYAIIRSTDLQKFYFDKYIEAKNIYTDALSENLKFAWVSKLGHSIINDMEIAIGGKTIDRQYGDWLNVWHELTKKEELEDAYNHMIGNIPELTTFDRTTKPSYTMRVPLQFWFCRHSGLSLPLVALEYHNVNFNVRFRNVEDVCYIEDGKQIVIPSLNDKLNLHELDDEQQIYLEAYLLIDYIYLDTNERRRFAQSSHEYLIEELQLNDYPDVEQQKMTCVLNFYHPCKELIWVAQKKKYLTNTTGYNRAMWDNYTISDTYEGNTIKSALIDFNSLNRVPLLHGNYFNYVQPSYNHTSTPSDGINVYSFAVFPEEHQPSGTANLSRIKRVTLRLEFDDSLYPQGELGENLILRVYTINYNILRIVNGMAMTAFTSH